MLIATLLVMLAMVILSFQCISMPINNVHTLAAVDTEVVNVRHS